jgi:hypothetical protein
VTLFFAITPRAFNWEIVGGGLTRSPGLFFAVLALWQAHILFSTRDVRRLPLAGLLAGATFMCHPEMGAFLAFSVGIFAVAAGWDRRMAGMCIALGTMTAIVAAPWWLEALIRVGPEPLWSAANAGDHSPLASFRLVAFNFTEEPLFPITAALGLLGVLVCIRERTYLLPVWIVAIFLLDPRKAYTVATVPLALLAAVALYEVVLPLLKTSSTAGVPGWAKAGGAFILLTFAPFAILLSSASGSSPLYALTPGDRDAMAWVRLSTAVDVAFVVIPSNERWALDAHSEWFPALAGRVSVATVQGYEWRGADAYARQQQSYEALQECSHQTVACLEAWTAERGVSYSHVYVPRGRVPLIGSAKDKEGIDCCAGMRVSLAASEAFVQVYDGPGATIFARR